MLFIIVCLLFSSSRSLLKLSYIFSILFPRFWIIFTIIILNSFSGRLPISSSFVWSGGFLPCSFIFCVFLCLLILLNLLCLGSPFHSLQFHSSHCFWCMPPVDKVGSVGCLGFLLEGTGACVVTDEAGSCLSGGRTTSGGVFWHVCELSMILGSFSANGWDCVPVLLVFGMGCPALELAGRWMEPGLSVEMEISGRALADWYYEGPGGLWWTNVLDLAFPPQRLRPDTQPEYQDPVSHTA